MNKKKEKFQELLLQKGDKALLDVKYIGVNADDIIDVYHELGLRSPITIVKSEPNPYLEKGWGNGYVRIPEGHPYYEKTYDDIPVSVHGGLTFSNHVFEDGEYFSDGYWVGFDTAHYGDTKERWPMDKVMEETIYLFKEIYGL
jgi:hypothetical protein